MIAYILYQLLGSTYPERQLLAIYDIISIFFFGLTFLVWMRVGILIKMWTLAWWKGCDIGWEWTKSRRWIPHLAKNEKTSSFVTELDDGRPIETRREAMGTGPHTVSMFIFPSEWGAMVAPTEADGLRYYSNNDWFYAVKDEAGKLIPVEPLTEEEAKLLGDETWVQEHVIEAETYRQKSLNWSNRRIWMRYPEHMTNYDEFVQHQNVDLDPVTLEAYGEWREQEATKALSNWTNSISANAHWLIPLIMVLLIAYMVIDSRMTCNTGAAQLQECAQKLVEYGKQCAAPVGEAITKGTGGEIK